MDKPDVYLNSRNAPKLWVFIGINITVFLAIVIFDKIEFKNIEDIWKVVSLKDGIIIAAIPLLSIILRGILSENQKNVLVFWRLKNPLPGCRAFSCLIGKDARITRTNLEHNLGVSTRSTKTKQSFSTATGSICSQGT